MSDSIARIPAAQHPPAHLLAVVALQMRWESLGMQAWPDDCQGRGRGRGRILAKDRQTVLSATSSNSA